MGITSSYFDRTKDGEDVYEYVLKNAHGMCVHVLEYACTITELWVPDKAGALQDVVLGFPKVADYEVSLTGAGMFVGRYANRIEGARFTLNDKTYHLEPNDGENHLHGTWMRRVFKGSVEGDSLLLRLHSPDGEEGYPGTMDVTVTYTLTDENALVIDYTATTDKTTILNLTNHSYFNLSGRGSDSMLDQTLHLYASRFTEANEQTCPTGHILDVAGTPMDFTQPKRIGQDIDAPYDQLRHAGGYDHNYIPDKEPGQLARIAGAYSAHTGIVLEAYSTQPGVQFYTGNYLGQEPMPDKTGVPLKRRQGFCLETQHYPCTPSPPEFPSVTLTPEGEFHETTIYKFSVKHSEEK